MFTLHETNSCPEKKWDFPKKEIWRLNLFSPAAGLIYAKGFFRGESLQGLQELNQHNSVLGCPAATYSNWVISPLYK